MLQTAEKVIAVRIARLSVVALRRDYRFAESKKLAHRDEFVALGLELRNGHRQRFESVPAASVRVPYNYGSRLCLMHHRICDAGSRHVRIGVSGRHVPLDGQHAGVIDGFQSCVVAGAVGEPKEPRQRSYPAHCGVRRCHALVCSKLRARVFVDFLRRQDLLARPFRRHEPQVAMRLRVVADFEQRIGHQLLGACAM